MQKLGFEIQNLISKTSNKYLLFDHFALEAANSRALPSPQTEKNKFILIRTIDLEIITSKIC